MRKFIGRIVLLAVLVCLMALCAGAMAQSEQATFTAGVLEQNSLEESARKTWLRENGHGAVRKQVKYQPFSSLNAMLMELNAGRVDYLGMPASVGRYLAARDPEMILCVRENKPVHYHMALNRSDADFCEELNTALETLRADGTLDKLEKTYIENVDGEPEAAPLLHHEGAETHVVGITGDLPPMDYVAADGTPAGYNVALLNAISEKTGCNFELVQLDAPARLSALASGKIDLVFWIGCQTDEACETEAEEILLTASYFEDGFCYGSHSAEVLDKAMVLYGKPSGETSE